MSTLKKLGLSFLIIFPLTLGIVFFLKHRDAQLSLQGNAPSVETTSSSADTSTSSQATDPGLLGQRLPDFTLTAPEGEVISNQSFAGKPTLYMEWASWCPHCQEQMPIIQNLYQVYGDRVNFVLANATGSRGETLDDAKSYMDSRHYTMPWYSDTDLMAANALAITSLPTILVIDENQTLVSRFDGVQEEESLAKLLDSLIP
ncbi:TlpA family protein disulfide reductase [Streptococcus moroccensis]|uniref:Thiol-disulfide isomerase/thioredoxin n=1 Tax=Streptococcus moroccensis TaxID=1451356 RepID=A0ABT9YPM6_9STRE|nr:TlpA disulfide reductase family protein [Streptococcus moroccensis]MDQ0221949.1 thiol-disulfide isomerase/thioredoxin [Streptococcus moroccensis]